MLLGVVCGLVAVAFNKLLHKGEDLYDEWKIHPLPADHGRACSGLMGYGFVLAPTR